MGCSLLGVSKDKAIFRASSLIFTQNGSCAISNASLPFLAVCLKLDRTHYKIPGHQNTSHHHTWNRMKSQGNARNCIIPFLLKRTARRTQHSYSLETCTKTTQTDISRPIAAVQVTALSVSQSEAQKATQKIVSREKTSSEYTFILVSWNHPEAFLLQLWRRKHLSKQFRRACSYHGEQP